MPQATFIPPRPDEIEPDVPAFQFAPPRPDEIEAAPPTVDQLHRPTPFASESLSTPEQESINRFADWQKAREAAPGYEPPFQPFKFASQVAGEVVANQINFPGKVLSAETGLKVPEIAKPGQPIIPPEVTQQVVRAVGGPVENIAADYIPAVKGLEKSAGKTLAGFTTPENIALLPFVAAKPVQALFAAQMIASAPQVAKQTIATLKDPNASTLEKWEAMGDAGSQLLMIIGLAHGLTHEQVKASYTPEQAANEVDQFWKGIQARGYEPPATPDIVHEAVMNLYRPTEPPGPPSGGGPGTPVPPVSDINAVIRQQLQPQEPNANPPLEQQEGAPTELPRTPSRPAILPNPTQIRQGQGGRPDDSNRTPRGGPPEPNAPETPLTLNAGDIAPVAFDILQDGAPHIGWYRPTQTFVSPEGKVYTPQSRVATGELQRWGFKIPDDELAKFKAAGGVERPVKPVEPEPEPVPTVTTLADKKKYPLVDLPVKSIKLSTEVPNFKSNADPNTGVVEGEQLQGNFEELGLAPIQVWQRLNGDLEVVSGRHRLDLARRQNIENISAQVLKESDGWTAKKVASLDAEQNIRDGQGTIFDYANFFKNSDINEQTATERGLLARAKGRAGYQLGRNAGDDLYAAYRAGRISEPAAIAIAESAPGRPELQSVGIKAALAGEKPDAIRGIMEAAQNAASTVGKADQADFFANTELDETWKKQGAYVAAKRRDLNDIIATRKAIVNKYQAATGTGSIKATLTKAQSELEAAQNELARWAQWSQHPDLRSEVENLGQNPKPAAPPLVLEKPESVEEQNARLAKEAAVRATAAEKQRLADLAAKGLVGKQGDIGQGNLLGEDDLLSRPNKPPAPFGSKNTIITTAKADELRQRIKDKLDQSKKMGIKPGKGLDPTIFSDAVQLGAYYIEGGIHRFADWSAKMLEDFGDMIANHLKSIYETARITIESPVGADRRGQPPGLQPGLRPPAERIIIARPEHTKPADESVIPPELVPHLDPHQKQGAAAAIKSLGVPGRNGFINADGTGAGKTRQALTVAHYYAKQGFKVMIVSKSETFKPNWKTNEFGGSYRFDSSAMGVPLEVVRDGNVAPGKIGITTYENMKSVERFTDSRTILIFDEAHALKNDSDRGRAGVRASAKANAVMFMSATPADKPVHIAYLARAGILEGKTIQQALVDLGMRLVEMDKMVKDDADRWVKRRLHFWTEDQNVSDNDRNARFSALFDRMTAQGAMIKREISMDGTHIQVMKVSLPPEAHELQQEILNFFDASHIDDLKGLKKAVVLGHQRRQQEPYKIAPTIMLAKRELDQGRQVVIFVSRVNASEVGKWVKTGGGFGGEQERVREVLMSSEGTAKTMREALEDAGIHDIAEIHGNADQSSLEAMADFQGGRKRVVIATIESGGTGINLDDTIGNRPRSMIVVTAPFDAVGNVQAAGRIWRLKTMSGSNLYYLFADTSVDDWNADIIGSKMATLGAVVEGQVRRLDISNPDAVDTDDYHEQVKERAPEAPKPVTAFPQMEWKPFTTKAGASKFVAPATADFWKWYEANGKQANPLNLRISKFNNQWQVWSDKPIASGPRQAQLPREAFYSRITRTVEQSPQAKATGEQWKGLIRNSKLGVNADEFGLVGVADLEDGRTYSKQEVLDYLKANEVKVVDVTLGDDLAGLSPQEVERYKYLVEAGANQTVFHLSQNEVEEWGKLRNKVHPKETHFSTYQLPGAKEGSYREVLLTVPDREQRLIIVPYPDKNKTGFAIQKPDGTYIGNPASEHPDVPSLWESEEYASKYGIPAHETVGWVDGHDQYRSIANPIVRLRFNERTTADGKKMLFLEELQPPKKGEFAKMPALFQKNWREIGFKWALRHAAENGFDSIGWTTGEQQAERYDLSKQVDKVEVIPRTDARTGEVTRSITIVQSNGGWRIDLGVDSKGMVDNASERSLQGKNLADVIGKDLAEKIMSSDFKPSPRKTAYEIWRDEQEAVLKANPSLRSKTNITESFYNQLPHNYRVKYETQAARQPQLGSQVYSGLDLKVGGIGLKKLYDTDFRNVVNGLPAVKKAGQKVGMEDLGAGSRVFRINSEIFHREGDATEYRVKEYGDEWRVQERAAPGEPWIQNTTTYKNQQDAINWISGVGREPIHSLSLTPALKESVLGGQALFQTGLGEEPVKVRPTTAIGLDQIREALSDPRLGYDARTVQVALDILKQPVFQKLDWSKLILAVRQKLEGGAKGAAWIADNLIEMSGAADATTFPHEVFHFLYELLPENYRKAIDDLRLAELRKIYGDNIPPELQAGTLTSDAFQRSGLNDNQYHLTTPSEFLAEFGSNRFKEESWKGRNEPAGFWEGFKADLKAWVRGIINTVKRAVRINPDMNRVYDELLGGVWKSTPESGAAWERKAPERQAQLPRTTEKAERELFFKAPGMGESLAASYGSVSKMTRAVADRVGANDRVKALLNLPKQEELAAIGTREVNLDNYYDVMNSIVNAPPAVKTEVTLGVWHLLNFEQSRSIFLEAAAAKQREVINSPKFLRKLERLDTRQINLDTLTQAQDTFLNLIGQEAGTVIRQMSEKKAIDAQYEQLQEDLQRLRQMPQFSNDVANRVQDIVDTLSMVDGGLDLLYQSTNKSGDNIYRTYLDIKQSITRIGEPRNPAEMLSEWDRQFLSDADKAKLAKPGMDVMSRDSKAFAKLASQVLAVNRDMSAKLATLSFLKADPEFAQKVTEVGRQFARQVAQDPVKAVDTLAQKAAKLGGRVSNAETAWAALNKDVTREIQKYTDANKAVDVLRELHASPEWQKLVNDIHANVEGSVRTPDVVRKQMKSSADVFNEFVSNPIFVSPEGGTYQIDLGGTKQQAVQSWNQSRAYLDDIDRWLGDEKNLNSPDRQFWLDRRDFVEAVYMASTVTAPPAVLPLLPKGSSHSAWIPDYLFEQMTLPAARVARITFDNMNASYAASSGWVYNVQEKVTGTMALASLSHGIPVQYGLKAYQEQVLNQMAYLARNGQKVPVGTRLDGGIIVNARDVAALKMQGESVNSLMNLVANAGREKVMTDRLLLDEWAAGQFGLRAAKELGGEAGTTLPHQFSDRGKVLSREVANLIAKGRPMGDIEAVLNQSNNFPYVRLFTEQRKASFVPSLSPFEDLYRQLADKFLSGAPDAPRDIDEVVDYLTDNTPEGMTREQVKAQFMGELTGRLQKFYKGFVEHDDPSDIRFSRTKTSSALTKGFVQDVENSFFYDYGMASDADVRALATDAQNYHVVRIDMALESLQNELVNRLNTLRNTPETEQAAFKKQARKELQSGASFLDFDRLENQLNELKMFRSAMPSWTGRRTIDAALVSKGTRIVGDVVSGRLTGWGTTARILVGSIYKMGTVYAALDHGMTFAWPKAAVSMAMSAFKVGVPSVAGGAYRVLRNTPGAVKAGLLTKGGLNVKLAVAIQHALEGVTEEIMRPSKYLAQQHQNGLVPDQLLGWRIANMLLMPQSRGRGYNPTKGRFLGNVPHNIGNLVLTAGELPLEVLRSYFPQLAYNIAYDSAARQAGWTVDVLEAAVRRAFDVHEKMGTLGKFDLNNPSNPKNTLLASEVMPIGLVPKTQTSLNIARNWFRTIDLPYNEAVLNFWKRLSETPKAERGNIRMLSADIADPAKAQDMAERRTVALMAEALRNVHHAAPSNRPWIMRSVPILRIINPFIGWTAQTSRQWFSLMGRAAHDPEHGNAFLWATSVASVLGVLAWAAFNGDTDKRAQGLVKWWMLKEADSAKHFGQGETVGENLKILASDATAHIAMLNTAVNSMLGLEGARGGMNFTPMLVNEVNGWLQLARGMISTHDFTYGLEKWAGQEVPFYRTVTSRLPSQQGLIEQRAARTLIDKYGDPDMKRSLGGITQAPLPTELSPYKEALANAIFKGNPEEVQQAYTEFVAKATAMGKQNPEQLAKTTIRSLNPYQQVFGAKLTDEQRQHLIGRMSSDEATRLTTAENNYENAAHSVGIGSEITRQPRAAGGAASGGAVSVPAGLGGGRVRTVSNRLRAPRGRSVSAGYRPSRLRAPRLRVSRQRFRSVRPRNRLRRRSIIA